jgi:hypothetical protein
MKGGPLVRGGIGLQGAVLFAPKSWLHVQVNAGSTTTLIADSSFARRDYGMFDSEIRFHFPNTYTFRGMFAGIYYSHSQGEHKYKDVNLVGSTLIKHITLYNSYADILGVVLGGSRVGKRKGYAYIEGFIAAGYAVKVTVTGTDTYYFPDLYTPIARRDRIELKAGVMFGIVGY